MALVHEILKIVYHVLKEKCDYKELGEHYADDRRKLIQIKYHKEALKNKIHYTLEDIEGVSAKGGGNGNVTIFYSTRYIEKSFAANDTAKLFFETRGVLLHELTHAYQLEPQGIGSYGTNRVFWAFIEGMADAVRVANGGFDGPNARPKGGNYMDGYRTAGCFFVWLRDNKDPEFLRKFNRSTLEVIPWSFDGAIKHILGNEYNIGKLWHEYQVAVGDIQAQ